MAWTLQTSPSPARPQAFVYFLSSSEWKWIFPEKSVPKSTLSFPRAALKVFRMRAANHYWQRMLGTVPAGKAAGCGRKGVEGTKNSDASLPIKHFFIVTGTKIATKMQFEGESIEAGIVIFQHREARKQRNCECGRVQGDGSMKSPKSSVYFTGK